MIFPPENRRCAEALNNGDFISVATYSGYRGTGRDYQGKEIFLKPDASDTELGSAVFEALSLSRVLKIEELDDFFHRDLISERYKNWVQSLLERFGYKNKRVLFKNMMSVDIKEKDGNLKFGPTRHEKLEAWGREKGDGIEDVIIPADSSPAEVGAALRLAFSRCR